MNLKEGLSTDQRWGDSQSKRCSKELCRFQVLLFVHLRLRSGQNLGAAVCVCMCVWHRWERGNHDVAWLLNFPNVVAKIEIEDRLHGGTVSSNIVAMSWSPCLIKNLG